MRAWAKVVAWIAVGLLGLGVLVFVLGPALFASVAYPLPPPYQKAICQESANYSISPSLLSGLIFVESRWDPTARSGSGAQGLTQFTQSTSIAVAARLGVSPFKPSDLISNPNLAIKFGAYYISGGISNYNGDKKKALIAYNGGGGAEAAYEKGFPISGTVAYANKVLATADEYDKIYGNFCSRTDLPDFTAKAQNPVNLVTTLPVTDFWKTLLFNRDVASTSSSPAAAPTPTTSPSSFWKNLIGQ